MSKVKFTEGDRVRIVKGKFKGKLATVIHVGRNLNRRYEGINIDRAVYTVEFDENVHNMTVGNSRGLYYSYELEKEDETKTIFKSPMCVSTTKIDNNGDITTGDGHYVTELSLNFGLGRIALGTAIRHWDAKIETPYIVMQVTKEPQVIGRSVETAEMDDRYPTVILNFTNEAGLDMLIEMANDIKKYYKEKRAGSETK